MRSWPFLFVRPAGGLGFHEQKADELKIALHPPADPVTVGAVSGSTFRVATGDDVAAIVRLVESAYRGESSRAGWTTEADLLDGQRTDEPAVRAITVADDRVALLAFDDRQDLLGCCELRRRPFDTAYFGMFAVVPTRQGGGIGKELLAAAEGWVVDAWGARRMEMTVLAQRGDLIEWYERRGYRRTGETEPFPYDDIRFGLPRQPDLHFVVMAKDLKAGI